jgi:hypothetical protein
MLGGHQIGFDMGGGGGTYELPEAREQVPETDEERRRRVIRESQISYPDDWETEHGYERYVGKNVAVIKAINYRSQEHKADEAKNAYGYGASQGSFNGYIDRMKKRGY